ncbi:MAG: T9SS type A sorting domain-containing protein, partial [FCB group bacterium]
TIYSFFENEVPRVKIKLPNGSNLYISVFNSYGVLITKYINYFDKGSHEFGFHSANIANGVYFISANNGYETKTAKFMKSGSSNGEMSYIEYIGTSSTSISKFNNTNITFTDEYRFIGYASGFNACTIDNIIPENNKNYVFMLKPYSPWTVRKASIKINLPAILSWKEDTYIGGQGKSYSGVDSTYFNFNFNFNDSIDESFHYDCDTLNDDNTINIRLCSYNGYGLYGINGFLTCTIDTLNKLLKALDINYYAEIRDNETGYYDYFKTSLSINITSINCYILNSNHISAELKKENIQVLPTCNYSNHDESGVLIPTYVKNTNLDKLLPADDNTYIKIELTE